MLGDGPLSHEGAYMRSGDATAPQLTYARDTAVRHMIWARPVANKIYCSFAEKMLISMSKFALIRIFMVVDKTVSFYGGWIISCANNGCDEVPIVNIMKILIAARARFCLRILPPWFPAYESDISKNLELMTRPQNPYSINSPNMSECPGTTEKPNNS